MIFRKERQPIANRQLNNMKLNWGIIGPGNIARDFVSDLKWVNGCSNTVTGVMSNKLAEAEEFAKTYSVPQWFDDIEEMLEKTSPDIVYIASPHSEHHKESLTCLQNKVAVLCEKPLALNYKQAEEMINMSRTNHTFLMEGMWIRFLPSISKVLEILQQKLLGQVNSIIADMSYVAPKDEHNRFYDPYLGGGSLLDLGIYPVYLSLLILGKPHNIKAAARLSRDQIDENCAIIFEYSDGIYSLLESSIIKNTDRQARVYGENGVLTLLKQWNEKPEAITLSLYNQKIQKFPCKWKGRGFQFEVEEVARCLGAGKIESDLHSHEDSLLLLKTLDEIRAKANIVYPVEAPDA